MAALMSTALFDSHCLTPPPSSSPPPIQIRKLFDSAEDLANKLRRATPASLAVVSVRMRSHMVKHEVPSSREGAADCAAAEEDRARSWGARCCVPEWTAALMLSAGPAGTPCVEKRAALVAGEPIRLGCDRPSALPAGPCSQPSLAMRRASILDAARDRPQQCARSLVASNSGEGTLQQRQAELARLSARAECVLRRLATVAAAQSPTLAVALDAAAPRAR
ncbi:hypothetical protein T492DRAFT_834662 [Pavlovales sp. CCMP2436]|nr:hypothetical protein T492DRAFT_834662 [Pavlovales sp. CCMP2436]